MKKKAIEYILDQRKLSTHIYFLLFSLLVVALTIVFKGDYHSWQKYFTALILIFVQLEVFIYLGIRIFKGFNPVSVPKELTRIMLSRFMLFFFSCFAAAFLLMITALYVGHWINYHDVTKVLYNFFHYEFRVWFKTTIAGLSTGAIIFVYILWQDALKREQKLKEENLIFQNETLKSQVNPHFLFNCLNTLSSLINSRPETAERFISRLSSIYRYILDNSSKDRVPLNEEISFIRDYFYLYKIRDDDKIRLDILIDDRNHFNILPVSLQILVENAIKHNMATREKPLIISIFNEDRYVIVLNNLQKRATQIGTTGIGLRNLAQRARLTSGAELVVEETEDHFLVKVPLM